jgi:hypothetical protein
LVFRFLFGLLWYCLLTFVGCSSTMSPHSSLEIKQGGWSMTILNLAKVFLVSVDFCGLNVEVSNFFLSVPAHDIDHFGMHLDTVWLVS